MKRTPWFNAQRDPPVNGDGDAKYEWQCLTQYRAKRRTKEWILRWSRVCPQCRWRGLLQPAKEQK